MTTILVINSSTTSDNSVSAYLAREVAVGLKSLDGSVRISTRDVDDDPLPHITHKTVSALRGEPTTAAERATRMVSDELIAELKAADIIIIGSPMMNFGISSTLKAWFDHVLRPGATFSYTPLGPQGLVEHKRAIVVETRGGTYSEGPATAMDSQEPHLRTMLGCMGISDVAFVRAEGLAFDPATATAAAVNDARGVARWALGGAS